MNISDEAVEAAARAYRDQQSELGYPKWDDLPEWGREMRLELMRKALEAATPILLSHERQQTADAHRDAIVNRDTADRLEQELQQAKAEAWQEGRQARHDHMIGKSPSNPYLEAAWEQGRVDGYHHRPNPYKEAGE